MNRRVVLLSHSRELPDGARKQAEEMKMAPEWRVSAKAGSDRVACYSETV